MIQKRNASERGYMTLDWLQSWHTFSFGQYSDPQHVNFRSLRVINEDIISPNGGFATHPHQDMEIISYVISGKIAHTDSMGHETVVAPGEIQRMSAGTGVEHSEYNPSTNDPTHMLQIWIFPETTGLAPSYEQVSYDPNASFQLIASPTPGPGRVKIHQDAFIYRGMFSAGDQHRYNIAANRNAWIQLAKGQISVNSINLDPGDGLAISDESNLLILASADAEFLLFDLG